MLVDEVVVSGCHFFGEVAVIGESVNSLGGVFSRALVRCIEREVGGNTCFEEVCTNNIPADSNWTAAGRPVGVDNITLRESAAVFLGKLYVDAFIA